MRIRVDLENTISIRGETLRLLPEKLIEWPAQKTLLVADTHFGKAATFRQFGIPVPEETTQAMLTRLTSVIERTNAERLLILGDFIHSNVKHAESFEAALATWRDHHRDLEILLLRGNHDRGRADLFATLNIEVAKSLTAGPFLFAHDAATLASGAESELYAFTGHIHPQVALSEGKKQLRLPCFWFGEHHAVLPAFGDFTGCATIKPTEGDRVFVIADGTVIPLHSLTFAKSNIVHGG